jgi:ribosomal protein L34
MGKTTRRSKPERPAILPHDKSMGFRLRTIRLPEHPAPLTRRRECENGGPVLRNRRSN